MYSNEQWEQTLNILLRESGLQGYVMYKDSLNQDQKGFWYFSPGSSGFLGYAAEDAKEAILTIIECVKDVNKPKSEKTSWINAIKKLFGSS